MPHKNATDELSQRKVDASGSAIFATASTTKPSKRTKCKANSKKEKSKSSDKRWTWKKPKGKPNRPLSAYNLFFKATRLVIIKEREERGQKGGAVATRWKSIDPVSKAVYDREAAILKAKYQVELEIWKKQTADAKEKEDASSPPPTSNKVAQIHSHSVVASQDLRSNVISPTSKEIQTPPRVSQNVAIAQTTSHFPYRCSPSPSFKTIIPVAVKPAPVKNQVPFAASTTTNMKPGGPVAAFPDIAAPITVLQGLSSSSMSGFQSGRAANDNQGNCGQQSGCYSSHNFGAYQSAASPQPSQGNFGISSQPTKDTPSVIDLSSMETTHDDSPHLSSQEAGDGMGSVTSATSSQFSYFDLQFDHFGHVAI